MSFAIATEKVFLVLCLFFGITVFLSFTKGGMRGIGSFDKITSSMNSKPTEENHYDHIKNRPFCNLEKGTEESAAYSSLRAEVKSARRLGQF